MKDKYTPMKKLLLFLLFPLLINKVSLKAQSNIGIVVDSAFLIPGDTFNLSNTTNYGIWLKNYGPSLYTPMALDSFQVVTAVRDTANATILNVVSINSVFDSIPANDSIYISLNSVFTNSASGFHKDINVIVIWPFASSSSTASIVDSLEFQIFLLDPNGISEIDLSTLVIAYPNPTFDEFTLENKAEIQIEEVRIVDTGGKLISVIKNQSKIETCTWSPGMYFISVLFENKQTGTIRIIKQK